MEPRRITIVATPRTKKTSNVTCEIGARCRLCRRGARTIVNPSKAYEAFEKLVAPKLQQAIQGMTAARVTCTVCRGKGRKSGKKCLGCGGAKVRAVLLTAPVLIEAVFYRDANRGDLMGFHQALGDVLQTGGVLANDELIKGWPMPRDGGLPLRKDAKRPRIELVITAVQPQQPALAGVN